MIQQFNCQVNTKGKLKHCWRDIHTPIFAASLFKTAEKCNQVCNQLMSLLHTRWNRVHQHTYSTHTHNGNNPVILNNMQR